MARFTGGQICGIILGIVGTLILLVAIILPLVGHIRTKAYAASFEQLGTDGTQVVTPDNYSSKSTDITVSPSTWADYRLDLTTSGADVKIYFTHGTPNATFSLNTDHRTPDHTRNFLTNTITFDGQGNMKSGYYSNSTTYYRSYVYVSACKGSTYLSIFSNNAISMNMNISRVDEDFDSCKLGGSILLWLADSGGVIFGLCAGIPALCCIACALGLFFGCRERENHYQGGYVQHQDQKYQGGYVQPHPQQPLMRQPRYDQNG